VELFVVGIFVSSTWNNDSSKTSFVHYRNAKLSPPDYLLSADRGRKCRALRLSEQAIKISAPPIR
jgi:hypothetical protein